VTRAVLEEVFGPEQVERARRYHRPLYGAFVAGVALGLGTLSALAFSPLGDALHRPVAPLPWWGEAPLFAGLVVVAGALVRLPLGFWRSQVHDKRWGFSTQGVGGWLWDRVKGLGLGVALNGLLFLGFVALVRALPTAWPAAVAPAGAAVVPVLTFLGPVVFEPVFNRFTPLPDEGLARELGELAARAGVPVRQVLVADASRRTRKENAYVSGLGATRRVVLYDTLLRRADPAQVKLVVAHELGHRRFRHVARGTALGMLGMAAGVLLVWALLSSPRVLEAVGASAPHDPRVVPFVLLVGGVLQLLAMPLEAALSRRWETEADRFSLELTGDLEVFERSHRELAVANLSDLDPPRLLYLWAFTHPTAPERVANARRWAGRRPPTTG
jgi:STE24 endopeptidase